MAIGAGVAAALFQDMLVVRGTALSNYPQLVVELGGDPKPLLLRAGIRPQDIEEYGVFVALRGAIQAVELAAEATETPDFGRRLALLQGIAGAAEVALGLQRETSPLCLTTTEDPPKRDFRPCRLAERGGAIRSTAALTTLGVLNC
jgi:Arabinose-binding domain of AraC transcription regulator, N-term